MPSLEREYRMMPVMEIRKAEDDHDDGSMIVEGYASTFEPYVLFTDPDTGTEYKEQIDPKAFDDADTSDVLFLYNHEGQVMARNRTGTLQLSTDDHGLKVVADLSKSARAREMYEEIQNGLVDQMSFAFTVEEDKYSRDTHTRTILRMRKLYDVSAVSMPANPGTAIQARSASWLDGAIEQDRAERAERLAAEEREKRIEALQAAIRKARKYDDTRTD